MRIPADGRQMAGDAGGAVVYEGRDLEAMSFAHNYHRWIVGELAPFLGERAAEVGAGSGDVSRLLLDAGVRHLLAVEPSAEMFPRLRDSVAGDARVDAWQALFADVAPEVAGTLDSAVYVNVLEHVPDDAAELAHVYRALKPGGHVCIFVPALSWLYSDFDASIGHFRRYHRAPLRKLLERSGFEVVRLRWFDLAGILPWLVVFRLMRRRLTGANVSAYDRFVVPVLGALERRIPVPIGKNLLAVGRKPLG
ncbi:MAG TPA: class I SAM-dependent methyltransferase [Longimicrobiaceae bacterium]|nr:class I SAM-dependent methyltransferase [Longimicrobiaceae bacterium]